MSSNRARAQQAKDCADWIAENTTSAEDAERLIREEFPTLPGGTRNAMALMWLRDRVKTRRGHRAALEAYAGAPPPHSAPRLPEGTPPTDFDG